MSACDSCSGIGFHDRDCPRNKTISIPGPHYIYGPCPRCGTSVRSDKNAPSHPCVDDRVAALKNAERIVRKLLDKDWVRSEAKWYVGDSETDKLFSTLSKLIERARDE